RPRVHALPVFNQAKESSATGHTNPDKKLATSWNHSDIFLTFPQCYTGGMSTRRRLWRGGALRVCARAWGIHLLLSSSSIVRPQGVCPLRHDGVASHAVRL